MNSPQAALEQTKRDFTYVSDENRDRWHLGPLEGPFRGDCEEFALTLLLRIAGAESVMFAMLAQGDARIERVLSDRGNGHAVLWLKGWGYVDSIHQFWRKDRLFDHKQTFSERQVRRKLDGKTVRGPANKALLILAGVCAAVTAFFFLGGAQ